MDKQWKVSEICAVQGYVWGITVDNNGNLYYVNRTPNIFIVRYNSNITQNKYSKIDSGKFLFRGIVWDRKNTLYMTSAGEYSSIEAYSIDTGQFWTLLGPQGRIKNYANYTVDSLLGLTIDQNGDLYFTDANRIHKIDMANQTVQLIAGCSVGITQGGFLDGSCAQAKFNTPCGIAIGEDGTIYVADTQNTCIRTIKDDHVKCIIGTPGRTQIQSGKFNQTLCSTPSAITIDKDGNILFCEDQNFIRKINLKKQIVQEMWRNTLKGFCCVVPKGRILFFATKNEIGRAYEDIWKWERYLWIGKLKEHPNTCPLAMLPKDTIKDIVYHLIQ